jgi:hypothetical protein
MPQQYYEEDDAEAILRLAAQKTTVGGMSRERLLETAAELGISEEAVRDAERSILENKAENGVRAEFDAHIKREFWTHFSSYLGTIAFMVAINLITSPHNFWAIWIIVPWGIGVAAHFSGAFLRGSSEYGENYEKWKLKKEGKLTGLGSASDLIQEWLAVHPGDASGAAKYVRENLDIDHSSARRLVSRQINQ